MNKKLSELVKGRQLIIERKWAVIKIKERKERLEKEENGRL